MAERSQFLTLPAVLYFVGLVVMFVGVVPMLRRSGGALEVGLAVAGAILIALGIVVAARVSGAGPGAGSGRV